LVRSTPDRGHKAKPNRPLLGAKTGCEQVQQTAGLLDHLIGKGDEPVWKVEAKRLGSPAVEDQLELRGLQHWQIGWLVALDNSPGVIADLAVSIGYTGP
jgi:hypothetical protein